MSDDLDNHSQARATFFQTLAETEITPTQKASFYKIFLQHILPPLFQIQQEISRGGLGEFDSLSYANLHFFHKFLNWPSSKSIKSMEDITLLTEWLPKTELFHNAFVACVRGKMVPGLKDLLDLIHESLDHDSPILGAKVNKFIAVIFEDIFQTFILAHLNKKFRRTYSLQFCHLLLDLVSQRSQDKGVSTAVVLNNLHGTTEDLIARLDSLRTVALNRHLPQLVLSDISALQKELQQAQSSAVPTPQHGTTTAELLVIKREAHRFIVLFPLLQVEEFWKQFPHVPKP